jgi:PAS domain S-box-containing protein
MSDERSLRLLVAVHEDDLFDRVERRLRSTLDADVVRLDAGVEAAAVESVDCVVVADDLPDADPQTVVAAAGDVPVVALLDPDGDHSAESVLAAGAADVVLVTETNLFERLDRRVASVLAWREDRAAAERRVTEDLKERAMDEAPVGITIADASLPDDPLVYVNDAFESLTGYDESEALGRNCRYLQGPGTDAEPVAELRRAVDAEESASVELLNYRRDGEPFWNRVDIAPVSDADGELSHYVGFQTDVTDRVRAERAAEHYAAVADRERERLRGLVDQVENLLVDVTEVLVRAETRAELERQVCERVADSPSYACAWVGDCDLSPDAVVPKEWAGEATAAVVGLRVDRQAVDDPVARAVATRSVQTLSDPEGRFHGDVVLPFGSVVAVPLVHSETLYGVLTVYREGEAPGEPERVALEALGSAVAAAIDAFESRRTLVTDSRLELRIRVADANAPLARLARANECSLRYRGSVARDDGTVLLFVSPTPADAELVAADVPGVQRVGRLERGGGDALAEVHLDSGSLLSLVAERGARLTDLSVTEDGTVELVVTVTDRSAGRTLIDELSAVAAGVTLDAVRERAGPASTPREFVSMVEDELTERQRTALQLAHLGGFFEWPHGTSGDELAASMDISRSTFHQHLRAAERKLVAAFYRETPN